MDGTIGIRVNESALDRVYPYSVEQNLLKEMGGCMESERTTGYIKESSIPKHLR